MTCQRSRLLIPSLLGVGFWLTNFREKQTFNSWWSLTKQCKETPSAYYLHPNLIPPLLSYVPYFLRRRQTKYLDDQYLVSILSSSCTAKICILASRAFFISFFLIPKFLSFPLAQFANEDSSKLETTIDIRINFLSSMFHWLHDRFHYSKLNILIHLWLSLGP